MPFDYVKFISDLMAPKTYPPQPCFDPPRLTALKKPISQSTIGILTSAGVQRRGDIPFAETNDLSYRLIGRETPLSELCIAHQTPVRFWALQDLNVAYPIDRFAELEAAGHIGGLAPKAVSLVGSISRFTELIEKTVPAVKEEFDAQGVDLVFLFPF